MIANATTKASESLSGIRKAAMLLILLGDKASAEIIKQLSEDEVQLVSREIARLDSISSENAEVLLEEFYQMNMAHDFVVRGGIDYAKKMLQSRLRSRGRETSDRQDRKGCRRRIRQPGHSSEGRPATACQIHPQRTPADDCSRSFALECLARGRFAGFAAV